MRSTMKFTANMPPARNLRKEVSMKPESNVRMVTLIAVICAGFLLLAACGENNGDGNVADMFAPGGVIIGEPSWARNIDVSFGGEEIDTSVPGNYGYYSEDGEFATIYDSDKKPFTFKKGSVKRIINLWPANTSGVLALGAEEFFIAKLSGMATPWQALMFPSYANLKTEVGTGTQAGAFNAEALMALDPDLIIAHPSGIDNLRGLEYRGKQLPVININFHTYQEMKVTYRVVGKILGGRVEDNAETWVRMLQANIDRAARGLAKTSARPIVYYTSGGMNGLNTTMTSTGASSVVTNEWTGYAGGKYWPELMRLLRNENISGQSGVNMELILKYPPQKVFIGGGRNADVESVLANKDGSSNPWAGIIADLGPDNIKYIPYALFDWARFGAESVLQILWAARNIHPEIFADPSSPDYIDIHMEVKNFYTNFVGYPISDAQVENILNGRPPSQ